MTRARRPVPSFLALAWCLSSACDDDAGVEEVDRGAKPIEARAAMAAAHVEIDEVHSIVTGTVDDAPFVMIASEDGTPVCAVAGEGPAMDWVDVHALVEGRLERLDARPPDVDADTAALLQHVAAR